MKRILSLTSMIWLIGMVLIAFTSCNKNEDLVTENAQEGGLVEPITANVPYKLGNTPQVDIYVYVPAGPAITKLKIMNSYFNAADGTTTNEVLLKEVNVSNGDTIMYSVTYTELSNGLVPALPADELLLEIGSKWTLRYISIMADGREVVNNATTEIGVANLYAGLYHVTGIFHHPTAGDRPINEDKFLSALSAYEVQTTLGDLGPNYPVKFIVDPSDNSVTVDELPPTAFDVYNTPGTNSRYDPATGMFYVWYEYVGGTGIRAIEEEYTPK